MERDWVFGNVVCIYCHWLFCFVFETVREEVVYLSAFWHIWNLIAALVIVFGRFVSLFTCRFCTVVSCQAGRCIHQIVIMGMSWDNVNNDSLVLKVLSGLKSFVVCFQGSFVAGLLWAPSWSQPVFARFCSKISLLFHGQIVIFNVVNGTVWAPIRGGRDSLADTL